MNLAEVLPHALASLAEHKLRSVLTMLGMIFGVGAVISMLSIGAGAERQALEMIERLGLRNILVRGRPLRPEDRAEIRKKSVGVSLRDGEAILEAIAAADRWTPRLQIQSYKTLAPGARSEARVFGVPALEESLTPVVVSEGRFLDRVDEKEHAQVCVIGPAVRRDLFGWGPAIGKLIKVNDVWLEVVGVLGEAPSGQEIQGVSLGSTAHEIHLPVTTAMRKFDRDPLDSPVDELIVRLKPGADPSAAAESVRTLLDRLHAGAADYEIVVPEGLLQQARRTQRLFNIVMGSIAGISLLVGGIGIMNIMLATVLERIREIGIRRAVGARRKDIRSQFVVESFTISLLGGVAGVLIGILLARLVASYAGWKTIVTFWSLLLSTGVSIGVGLVSGIYPAMRAASLDPIEALRHE